MSGYPAIANSEWRRSSAVFRKLPEMRKQLRALEERLRALEENKNKNKEQRTKKRFYKVEPDEETLDLMLVLVAAAVAIWYAPLQAAVRPPKLEYQRLVLPNGMVVILHQDKSTPIVHVELWYHVGSKNESRAAPASRISSST